MFVPRIDLPKNHQYARLNHNLLLRHSNLPGHNDFARIRVFVSDGDKVLTGTRRLIRRLDRNRQLPGFPRLDRSCRNLRRKASATGYHVSNLNILIPHSSEVEVFRKHRLHFGRNLTAIDQIGFKHQRWLIFRHRQGRGRRWHQLNDQTQNDWKQNHRKPKASSALCHLGGVHFAKPST